MRSLLVPGLDAQNPLAFLAALGLLKLLDERARSDGQKRPSLSFLDEGRWTPQLDTPLTMDAVIEIVLEDARAQAGTPALGLAYTEDGKRIPADYEGALRDLKPSPVVAREFLAACAEGHRRTADLAAGLFSELVQDNNGSTKPTALHFTAGQQSFLRMVEDLRAGLTNKTLHEALEGPWVNESTLPSLAWDSSVTRLYALRARNPSGEKRGSVPAANWLAVQALAFFPVFAKRRRLVTTRIDGGWKDSIFTWPMWSARLTVPLVGAVLRSDIRRMTAKERQAVGVESVFSAKILRTDQGGYGSFSPADVTVPYDERPGF